MYAILNITTGQEVGRYAAYAQAAELCRMLSGSVGGYFVMQF